MFTREDAEDEAYFKQELSGSLQGVAAREYPQLYDAFLQVCDDVGVSPGDELADMVIKALNDEGFAEQLKGTEVELRSVHINEMREEDLDYLLDMRGKLRDHGEGSTGPVLDINELVKRRLDRMTGGPLAAIGDEGDGGASRRELREITSAIESLSAEVKRLEERVERSEPGQEPSREDDVSVDSIDDLFEEEEPDEAVSVSDPITPADGTEVEE